VSDKVQLRWQINRAGGRPSHPQCDADHGVGPLFALTHQTGLTALRTRYRGQGPGRVQRNGRWLAA
jgi:hypothetical protein